MKSNALLFVSGDSIPLLVIDPFEVLYLKPAILPIVISAKNLSLILIPAAGAAEIEKMLVFVFDLEFNEDVIGKKGFINWKEC